MHRTHVPDGVLEELQGVTIAFDVVMTGLEHVCSDTTAVIDELIRLERKVAAAKTMWVGLAME